MAHRPSFDELGVATARLWATRSADSKVQVGACLLDHFNRVVGVGYNGRAAGEPNERESLEQGMSGGQRAAGRQLERRGPHALHHPRALRHLRAADRQQPAGAAGGLRRQLHRTGPAGLGTAIR